LTTTTKTNGTYIDAIARRRKETAAMEVWNSEDSRMAREAALYLLGYAKGLKDAGKPLPLSDAHFSDLNRLVRHGLSHVEGRAVAAEP
jgi:hypothetical protein